MSRLGKLPIKYSEKTTVKITDNVIIVKGEKGELKQCIDSLVKVAHDETKKEIVVSVKNKDNKKEKAFWGLYRSLINNMVVGVENGFERKLEVNGVGYRVAVAGKKLTLNVGYSHPVDFELPEGVAAIVEKNLITLTSYDKQLLGQAAASIRKIRKPEPYKGKGIKYLEEIIIKKEGKTAGKGE